MRKPPFSVKEEGQTYEDYAAIPESQGRFELADGQLWAMSPAPSTTHQVVSSYLHHELFKCEENYILCAAPIDVILSSHSVLQPDLVLVKRDRLDIITERGIEGPPDLIVEILSPSTAKRDRGRKMEIYAYYGVPEYWLVDIGNRLIEQYDLDKGIFRLANIFTESDEVCSENIPCVSFTLHDVMTRIPNILNHM